MSESRFQGRISRGLLMTCALLMVGSQMASAESMLYVSGNLGIAGATTESGGNNIQSGLPNTGSDKDSSPRYGGALGIAWPIDSMLPWDIGLPAWDSRYEIEMIGGRNFEFTTQGALPYNSKVTGWSMMNNLFLDVPVHGAVAALFGRIPVLEPLTINLGFGIGVSKAEMTVTDSASVGSDDATNFAYQLGVGLGYAFTERVTFTFGYRAFDMGSLETRLITAGSVDNGNFTLNNSGNEIASSLRVSFYALPGFGD